MKLTQQMETDGRWLFRYRSHLPLVVIAAGAFSFRDFSYPLGALGWQEVWTALCLALSLVGLLVRMATVGCAPGRTSGRNMRAQVADTLNTTGIYSLVRHPLYLGNLLIWLGVAAVPRSLSTFVIVALLFWIYHERIICTEEAFLEQKFGDGFRAWAARTPTFIPDPRLWIRPSLSFSLRHAVAREYLGAFAIASVFVVYETAAGSFAEGRVRWNPPWVAGWVAALALFLLVRWLAKRTALLTVPGR